MNLLGVGKSLNNSGYVTVASTDLIYIYVTIVSILYLPPPLIL